MIIVLIALIAVPASKHMGIMTKKPMCGVMLGLKSGGNELWDLNQVFDSSTGSCEYAPYTGIYYFR
jgi:hypothetical protein